ncbi:MAG TPA: DUF6492 family protein [Polyangiaceae bacterium]|nr:DUF6492 family protein [Polyangiaceae bacterium]
MSALVDTKVSRIASMDAVLPLTLRDVPRASLLLESLSRRFSGLSKLWVVVPERELSAVARALSDAPRGLPLELVGEAALVPELSLTPLLKGWYRQQLVKLAIFERVSSELYLTLDADVICTKPVSAELLAPGGLGPCHVTERDLHPDWYRGSEALLGLAAPRRGVSHNVTPAVLHRRGVAELAEYLDRKARIGAFSGGLRGIKQRLLCARARRRRREAFAGWRLLLAAGTPWTEYALYYTFLESTGRFERFHSRSGACIYDLEGSFWRGDGKPFSAWAPSACFSGEGAPWFVVVQSNAHVAPALVRQKLESYLCHD